MGFGGVESGLPRQTIMFEQEPAAVLFAVLGKGGKLILKKARGIEGEENY
jgi:hypothetical protein